MERRARRCRDSQFSFTVGTQTVTAIAGKSIGDGRLQRRGSRRSRARSSRSPRRRRPASRSRRLTAGGNATITSVRRAASSRSTAGVGANIVYLRERAECAAADRLRRDLQGRRTTSSSTGRSTSSSRARPGRTSTCTPTARRRGHPRRPVLRPDQGRRRQRRRSPRRRRRRRRCSRSGPSDPNTLGLTNLDQRHRDGGRAGELRHVGRGAGALREQDADRDAQDLQVPADRQRGARGPDVHLQGHGRPVRRRTRRTRCRSSPAPARTAPARSSPTRTASRLRSRSGATPPRSSRTGTRSSTPAAARGWTTGVDDGRRGREQHPVLERRARPARDLQEHDRRATIRWASCSRSTT